MAEWTRAKDCSANSCIEVRGVFRGSEIEIREPTSGLGLRFTRDEWSSFVAGVKAGDFDHIGDRPVSNVPMYSDNQVLAARVEAQLGERARIRGELVAIIGDGDASTDHLLDAILAL
jgi:Domain of unknown function (DUF397)